jgi:hypothetical protein
MQHGHPLLDNEHNAGQRTTSHRVVEAARQQAAIEGQHPEHGKFQRKFPDSPDEWKSHNPHLHTYRAPGGDTVTVHHLTRAAEHAAAREGKEVVPTPPEDRKVKVNGKEMFEPAAREYLGARHGIDL